MLSFFQKAEKRKQTKLRKQNQDKSSQVDFQNDDYLYFIVKVEYGKIEDLKMYFQDIFQISTSYIDLTKIVNPCNRETNSIPGESYNIYDHCYYAIPKPKNNYIIFSIPKYRILTGRGKVTIENSALGCSGCIKENFYLNVNTGDYEECYDICKKCSKEELKTSIC